MLPITLSITTITTIATFISVVGGALLTIRRIASNYEKSKRSHAASIIQLAKEADNLIKTELNIKIHNLELKVKNHKESTDKDLLHLKETYNNEIKFLGQKIEELRNELLQQHSGIVQLLSKLVDKR